MVSNKHPMVKTAIDIRRTIHRLEVWMQMSPNETDEIGVAAMVDKLQDLRKSIPKEYLDADLKEN